MNDQNTATAKRLNTLTQTKKMRATNTVAMKSTIGMPPGSVMSSCSVTKVAVNIHGNALTPPAMPIWSRNGRST